VVEVQDLIVSSEGAQPMNDYYLNKNVYLAVTLNNAIFMNLNDGLYFGLNGEQTLALSRVVRGWPAARDSDSSDDCTTQSAVELADHLAARGLLTTCADHGRPARQIEVPRVQAALRDVPRNPKIAVRDVFRMVRALLFAFAALRNHATARALRLVQQRKTRHAKRFAQPNLQDYKRVIAVFLYLRPWFYGAVDRCLFDSLVLITFLSHYGLYPTWVIGVKTKPFGAHSWVQHQDCVLNGTVEAVGDFAPIYAV
jgi:hypothetical protein